jgi:hypothetical protein
LKEQEEETKQTSFYLEHVKITTIQSFSEHFSSDKWRASHLANKVLVALP